MAAIYNDQSVPFGSKVVTIGTTEYIAESISLTRPSKIIERPNQIGEPNGWVSVRGFEHGTCTLQIPTLEAGYPALGSEVTGIFEGETWVIVDMTQPYAIADYWKCNATIRLKTT